MLERFQGWIRQAVVLFLCLIVSLATIQCFVLFARNAWSIIGSLEDVAGMQDAVMRAFAGALLVPLGLELIETLRMEARDDAARLRLVLGAALIGVGRHVLLLDFHHASGLQLLGVSAVVATIAVSYWLVRRASMTAHEEA